jgi:hypothetical protein
MFNITFPANTGQRYYNIHFKYVLNIFKYIGCNINFYDTSSFTCKIEGKEVLIDFSNSNENLNITTPTFKFQCKEETDNIFAFPKVSFYDWDEYFNLEKKIKYSANGYINYRQRAYGGATQRRNNIKELLKTISNVRSENLLQTTYWTEINNTSIAIFVPGYNNNILDRGQFQYMAFGCCTISPYLPEILPFNNRIKPNIHYIQCADDYSDLIDKIEYCQQNKAHCIEIGNNAKQLFLQTSIPDKIGEWIKENI